MHIVEEFPRKVREIENTFIPLPDGTKLAARICQACEPGTITVTGVVRDLTAGKRFLFADLGEHVPRGFEDPVRLYQVRW